MEEKPNKHKSPIAQFQQSETFRTAFQMWKEGKSISASEIDKRLNEMKDIVNDLRESQRLPNPIVDSTKHIEHSIASMERSHRQLENTVKRAEAVISSTKNTTELFYELEEKVDKIADIVIPKMVCSQCRQPFPVEKGLSQCPHCGVQFPPLP